MQEIPIQGSWRIKILKPTTEPKSRGLSYERMELRCMWMVVCKGIQSKLGLVDWFEIAWESSCVGFMEEQGMQIFCMWRLWGYCKGYNFVGREDTTKCSATLIFLALLMR
ncbi:hypothetical protein VNO78_07941 [Psophocarpus tetragonolobus]|uniref:Uncharacterized protein n=1 Tax=Psophocarpus tetragonolobus TaxID=3891 RepID=A0AAN9SU47_PSOTE